jgi:lauroyl/myristoyl acyltransferase
MLQVGILSAIRAIVAVMARLPLPSAILFGKLVSYRWQRSLRFIHWSNLSNCYGAGAWNEARLRAFAWQRADYFARFGVVIGRLFAATQGSLRHWSSIIGDGLLRQALSQKRGALFLGGHYGFWFLAPFILAANGHRVAVVVRAVKVPCVERLVRRLAHRHGVTLIHIGRDARLAIQRALHDNMVVCMAYDVSFRKKAGRPFRFGLGIIHPDPGAAVVAVRNRPPVFLASIAVRKALEAHVELEHAACVSPGERKAPEELLQDWCDWTYDQVSRNPAHWICWDERDTVKPACSPAPQTGLPHRSDPHAC